MSATNTPPFLVWALGYQCPIRGFQDGSDPEHTERQLRAAVATSDARREGRIFDGYAVDGSLGFRVDEALAIYGGLSAIEQACGPCRANTVAANEPGAVAGCHGMFVLPVDDAAFYERVQRAVEELCNAGNYSRLFTPTKPQWQGFWAASPLSAEQVIYVCEVLERLLTDAHLLAGLLGGLRVARDQRLPFHARLYPRGVIENNWWRLTRHCPWCTGEWKATGRGRCDVCDYEGHPAPDKKRRARGRRPYLPLARLMGEQNACDFLKRYRSRLQ